MRAAIRTASGTILGFSLLVLLALAIGPRTGAYRTLTVLSGSMAPAIPAGSVVVVAPMAARDLRVGDVITFQAPTGSVVTHRVVRIDQPGDHPIIETKGDASESADPWRARIEDPVVWRYRTSIPHLGRAIVALRTPWTQRVLVLALPFVLAAVWLRDLWRRPMPEPGPIRLMPRRTDAPAA